MTKKAHICMLSLMCTGNLTPSTYYNLIKSCKSYHPSLASSGKCSCRSSTALWVDTESRSRCNCNTVPLRVCSRQGTYSPAVPQTGDAPVTNRTPLIAAAYNILWRPNQEGNPMGPGLLLHTVKIVPFQRTSTSWIWVWLLLRGGGGLDD